MEKEELLSLQKRVTLLRAEGKYKETIEACYHLLERGLKYNDHKSMLIAHLGNVASYYCIGDIEEAFNSIDAYKEICNPYGDQTDFLQLYNVSLLLYEYTKDYQKAKTTLEKSIALGKTLKKYNIVSNGYSNYSHIFMLEKQYQDALKMANIGLEMADLHKPEYPILQLRVKLNIAKAYIGLGNFDASKTLIDEMIHDPILDSFIREKSQCYDLQGFWYSKQHLYKEALDSFTYAKELVESYKDIYLLKTIQEERMNLCDLLNDIETGYIVQKEYISLLNEINNRELSLVALKLEVKHSIADMEKKANTDYLTGISNRNYLETTADHWLKQAAEKNENVVCIAFDIDNFKSINDLHGHLFGDEVIKQASKIIVKIFRKTDLIGRYGGDEFVVILRDISLAAGKKKAEQIKENLQNDKITNDENSVSISVSIGIADNSQGSVKTFTELFHLADLGLYEAKRNGKNQIYVNA